MAPPPAAPRPGRPGAGPARHRPRPAATSPARAPTDDDEAIDLAELRDADDVATGGVDLLLREFGGGEVIEEDG